VCTALIPLLAADSATFDWAKVLTGALGAVIAIATGVQALFRFREKWVRWRSTWQALVRESQLYLPNAGHYEKSVNKEQHLAKRTDRLIGDEFSTWQASQKKGGNSERPKQA
jgi:hypothetical protein